MNIGDEVPEFSLLDQDGAERSFSGLVAQGPVVLYFYPMAMTPGCTSEGCSFRDRGAEFTSIGAQRVGISHDSVARQKEFSDKNHFDFPLLSDPDGKVASIFGTKRPLPFLPTKRWTFVIGTDRKVKDIIKSELRMGQHAERAAAALKG